MKYINLKCGKHVLVDDEDYLRVNAYRWCLSGNGHVSGQDRYNGKVFGTYIHHFIVGQPLKPLETDHTNRNPLDNRKENLRHVSRHIQRLNQKVRSDNTSGIVGVSRYRNNLWQADRVTGEHKNGFKSKKDALLWRNWNEAKV